MKRRAWVALALLALWPFAQRALVESVRASPWELGGWGMYAEPDLEVDVTVLVGHGGPLAIDLPERRELAASSRALGELAPAAPLARAVLDARPDLREIRIVRRFTRLRADGRLRSAKRTDRFARGSP